MTLSDFYHAVRDACPELTAAADILHIETWGELGEDRAFNWFERLAKALNLEMARSIDPATAKALFDLLGNEHRTAQNDVKKCIDVSLMENLFWQIPAQKAVSFWHVLPENLKTLYVNFHGRSPL